MVIASFVLSCLSIVISVLLSIWAIKSSKRINDINLEAELLKEFIKEQLVEDFPNAWSNICFTKGNLTGTDDLQKAINTLLSKIRFFKFYDPEFYNKVKQKGQELEDFIVQQDGKHFDADDISPVLDDINKMISELYDIIKSKYHNGQAS